MSFAAGVAVGIFFAVFVYSVAAEASLEQCRSMTGATTCVMVAAPIR